MEVYCIRSFRPDSPQAQVAVSLFVRFSAAILATSTRAESAIHGSIPESEVAACGNSAPGRSSAVNLPRLRNTRPGKTPIATHAAARAPMPACMGRGTSLALAASRLRGRPRKATPYTFAKHAAANPPMSASTPAARGRMMAAEKFDISEPARKLRKVSHSLTKPLNNGNPTMEQQAIRNAVPVRGIRFSKPPSSSRSTVCAASEIAPAPRNRRLLKMAWFKQWSRAAVRASAAQTGEWLAANTSAAPRPR